MPFLISFAFGCAVLALLWRGIPARLRPAPSEAFEPESANPAPATKGAPSAPPRPQAAAGLPATPPTPTAAPQAAAGLDRDSLEEAMTEVLRDAARQHGLEV